MRIPAVPGRRRVSGCHRSLEAHAWILPTRRTTWPSRHNLRDAHASMQPRGPWSPPRERRWPTDQQAAGGSGSGAAPDAIRGSAAATLACPPSACSAGPGHSGGAKTTRPGDGRSAAGRTRAGGLRLAPRASNDDPLHPRVPRRAMRVVPDLPPWACGLPMRPLCRCRDCGSAPGGGSCSSIRGVRRLRDPLCCRGQRMALSGARLGPVGTLVSLGIPRSPGH